MMEKQKERLKLLKAVAKVYCGITVKQFNEKFKGMSYERIKRQLVLVQTERLQCGGDLVW